MQIHSSLHLTYCSNIHAGESWEATFANLQKYIPVLRENLRVEKFGIGLRLSNEAGLELEQPEKLAEFKTWLDENTCYVFTMNGFPYGGFHRQVVKDEVHRPDWTTPERIAYTQRLFQILAALLPEGVEGGISTSPLSYKHWWPVEEEFVKTLEKTTKNLLPVLDLLLEIKETTGKHLHLDIEPEPDGLLECTDEVLDFYKKYLIPLGVAHVQKTRKIAAKDAEELIKAHIQICYDVCHFAVAFEDHAHALRRLKEAGIKIGKFQISAALKADLSGKKYARQEVLDALSVFDEPTYLHQVVEKLNTGSFRHHKDLPEAFQNPERKETEEFRIHFHVPVFLKEYGILQSTQEDILQVFQLLKQESYSQHLEVETYTWDVLPSALQTDMLRSIQRELEWVRERV